MAFARMTIAIASYERRSKLLRLLHALDEQVATTPDLGEDLQIVVVLDGSTDGSQEAVEAAVWSVPVDVRWQPNRGLAAARNVGLRAAAGGVVWFLDDDVIPSPGLLERHRRSHDPLGRRIVVGPCLIPPGTEGPPEVLAWWSTFHGRLAPGGQIDRYELFTAANSSGAASVFAEVGGFDETFTSYGLEDYELAVRLLAAGVPLIFDADAVAWHPDIEDRRVHVGRERAIGLNSTLIVHRHPETLDLLFPLDPQGASFRLLALTRVRRPGLLMMMSHVAFAASRLARRPFAIASRIEHFARAAARTAGVAAGDRDGTLLDRLLGYPKGGRARRARSRSIARASRQPPTIPTSNDPTISR